MRGRRRKTKYNWLPVYGTPNSGDPTFFSTSQQLSLTVPTVTGDWVTGWTPIVVNDVPNEVSEENFPLNDIIGNEYIIKRIVGKCPIDLNYITTSIATPAQFQPAIVAAGFYVARRDQLGSNFDPIDSAGANAFYNPLNTGLAREPWIWRRSWILGVGSKFNDPIDAMAAGQVTNQTCAAATSFGGSASYPPNNVLYGSVLDGPHIDAKTGRRVRQDEALFFGFACHRYPLAAGPISGVDMFVNFHLDVRVLGALRRPRNRSNF